MDKETLMKKANEIINQLLSGSKTMEDLIKFLKENPIDESE
jgi:hypothetical protein